MADYIAGKVARGGEAGWAAQGPGGGPEARHGSGAGPLEFSAEARALFDAGRELWRRYRAADAAPQAPQDRPPANANASLYDIREHFRGRDAVGRMSAKSRDGRFNELDAALRAALMALAKKIEPKVYEHGFLKR